MNQSKAPSEVLIFDDCSTDNSVKIVTDFIKENRLETWHLYINKQNKGWRVNFIDGIKKARGKFIFTCDQDDIWLQNKIKVQCNVMNRHNSIKVLASNYYTFNQVFKYPDNIEYSSKVSRVKWSNKFMNVEKPGCTYCFRKEFIELIMPYWKPEYEHDAFIWRMALADNSLAICDDRLIAWRIYKDSTLSQEHIKRSQAKRIEKINIEIEMLKGMREFLNKHEVIGRQIGTIDKYEKLLYSRKTFVSKKTLSSFIGLLYNFNFYGYKKQFVRDLLTAIENRKEN